MKSCQTTESIISSHKINQHVLHYETEIVVRTKTETTHYHIPENYPPTDYSKSRKRAPILIQRQECVYIITLTWKKLAEKAISCVWQGGESSTKTRGYFRQRNTSSAPYSAALYWNAEIGHSDATSLSLYIKYNIKTLKNGFEKLIKKKNSFNNKI